MQYRKIGKLDIQVSALGVGAMRLPVIDKDDTRIDKDHAARMMAHAFDNGINYVDTAYPYHGGNSETVVGTVLNQGYRDKVYLATKLPTWLVNKPSDFDALLNEQFKRLQTDHIDFYLLHNLNASVWPKMRDLGIMEWCEKIRAQDRISHFGFSFHDSFDTLKTIVDSYDWSFCQIQYNYMNENVQAGTKGLKYASGKGLGVIIMEPLFGGTLVRLPENINALWNKYKCDRSTADLALQWLWNKKEVSMVLSGMSTIDQTKENVASASKSGVNTLTQNELDLISEIQKVFQGARLIPCSKCGYCIPCPEGVNIPVNFEYYNDAKTFGGNTASLSKNLYLGLPETSKASACVQCKACEEKCPQGIEISDWLTKINKEFTGTC